MIGCALMASAMACSTGDPAAPSGALPARPVPPASLPKAPDVVSAAREDAGTVTIRRLNRVEYDNTVRDLIANAPSFAASFPPDDGAGGFTNVADALTMSPLLFERYEAAADELASAALLDPTVVTCDPRALGGDACVTQILGHFAKRAWRRPVAADELTRLVGMVRDAETRGLTFAEGLHLALESTLLSVSFLFRIELDPDPASDVPHPLTEYELASRLSYFLWSTMPDDVLFAYADAKKLSEPATFEREVHRMLKDPRAAALVDDFASQWLLQTLSGATPDAAVFPGFDEALRASMGAETKAFVGSFLFEDQSLLDVFDAPFTYLDGRMAAHYGIPGLTGTRLVRVPLWPGTHRGGLLTQASVLTMTSEADHTSPARRGEWILAELLCTAAPGELSPSDAGAPLEHYDAIGRWRDADHGLPIDATGKLPAGPAVDGAAALATAIKNDARFPACATRKLFAYALGRAPAPSDAQRIADLTVAFARSGHRTRDLIMGIVTSSAFRTRHGGQ